ncbi:flagellar hook protein FlgE [Arthrobacter sp. AL08]|uniref:flagellar hook protein FlgE n=1 Tax=Micrococcaceae TaxID=1268 RepID=UPI001CFF913B|nr:MULTISPECIES: flagellar hook protein FlgE [Micrococcaceae]MCB5283781.1 Flagellar hook protein FlgE [Arthrobacter sp. ES1]MDI3242945.1 flagellar hook protein FlgE [Arthrobacter sp. AL05]MDI3278985.1 flagellar hook protein FlgE [Arthrobacter sp. AL08]MDJ0353348.1 flagellar hook protein FlgE [Pseudarthrobacter sp. PH31-O2]WGZ79949.1 flagellar hook protein FlgE [Arthrobacter sp. EM1]
MLRSLYSGISGLRAHQTMLDVTGANIANVNTAGYKSGTTQFQDTLSQLTQGATAPQGGTGGSNPAQIGLGVRVAGVTNNFSQGSSQATGKATDMMISGDGFFVTSKGGQQLFTRAGAFNLDAAGQLVSPDGGILQGWKADANGAVNTTGAVGTITLNPNNMVATATNAVSLDGNLPGDATVPTSLNRVVKVYDGAGAARDLNLTFDKTATGWNVTGNDGSGPVTVGLAQGANGTLTASGALTVGGITVALNKLSGYAKVETLTVAGQNGSAAGSLESYTLGSDGSLIGSFSNGTKQVMAKIALAKFTNPAGLEKAGSSSYTATGNSGGVQFGSAGAPGLGTLSGGTLEMSNVDLSQEFTNLIVAQRGFQANARIITTSDEVLQELTQLKR